MAKVPSRTRVKRNGSIKAKTKDVKPLSTMRMHDRENSLSIFFVEVTDIVSAHFKSGNGSQPVADEYDFIPPPNMLTYHCKMGWTN